MDVHVVRHGEAEPAAARGGDAARRLTREGQREFARAARGLALLDPEIDRILSSPLVRARETAEILREALGGPEPEACSWLAPGTAPERVLSALRGAGGSVALVGHEPGLGRLVSLAVSGRAGAGTPLRKGGVARLRFEGEPRAGEGRLVWLLTPRILRRLGR